MVSAPISSEFIVGPLAWREGRTPPESETLPQLLEFFAKVQPDSPALVSGERRFSYAEFDARAKTFAAGLEAIGAKPGTRIGVLAPNIEEWMVAAFAALRFGEPVQLFNTWALAWDLEYLLSASEIEILVTVSHVRSTDLLAEIGKIAPDLWSEAGRAERFPHLREIILIDRPMTGSEIPTRARYFEEVMRLGSARTTPPDASTADSAAYVMYTSGTTERPKAVPLKHREMIENGFAIGERMGLTSQDRVWLSSPLFWSFGGANAAMATLTHGACLVLHEVFTPQSAAEVLAKERCTAAYLLPSAIAALVDEVASEVSAIDSLRTGLTIGRPEEVRRAVDQLGISNICNVYGSTEVYGNCCVTYHDMPLESRLTCQGPPLEGVMFRIVDQESQKVLPIGEAGELQVKGRVMAGYIGDPVATKRAITEDGWYRTGDTGRLQSDGTFQFVARHTEMIKTSGINVSPLEVEGFIASHDSVSEVVVVGAPHPSKGEVPVAFVVAKRGVELLATELMQYCRSSIASFKVPWIVEIVDQLPKTTTGKIMRKSLASTADSLVKNRLREEGK